LPRLEEYGLFRNVEDEESWNEETEGEENFEFPSLDLKQNVVMKNIPPSMLPNLLSMATEDRDTSYLNFTFYFEVTIIKMMLKN